MVSRSRSSRGRRRGKRGSRRWIQKAIKHPGALKAWLRRNRRKIKRLTGMDPFTRSGEVNTRALQKLRRTDWYERLDTETKRRINLAITLERLRRDR